MRTFLVLAILALAAVPVGVATPQCNTFTQTRSIATLSVTVTTSSCYDSYADPMYGYGQQVWYNVTSTTVTDGAGASATVYDYGQWYYSYGPGYTSEQWYHYYSVGANDGAGEQVGANIQESQGTWSNGMNSACNGGLYGGEYQYARTGTSTGESFQQNWGDGQMLSCTDRSTQETLP